MGLSGSPRSVRVGFGAQPRLKKPRLARRTPRQETAHSVLDTGERRGRSGLRVPGKAALPFEPPTALRLPEHLLGSPEQGP